MDNRLIKALQQNKRPFGLMQTNLFDNRCMRVTSEEIGKCGNFETYRGRENPWCPIKEGASGIFNYEHTYRLREDYIEEAKYELREIHLHGGCLSYGNDNYPHLCLSVAPTKTNFAGYLYDDGVLCSDAVRYFGADNIEVFRPTFDRIKSGEITIKRPYPNGNVVFKK